MTKEFIIVPDLQIFETACLAREAGSKDHPCLQLFKKAWIHKIDSREKIIHISKNLDDHLIKKRLKSEKNKRQALFSILRVREEFSDCEAQISQIKLASRLSIEEDKKVYYVTDNKEIYDLLHNKANFEVIDSSKTVNLFNF